MSTEFLLYDSIEYLYYNNGHGNERLTPRPVAIHESELRMAAYESILPRLTAYLRSSLFQHPVVTTLFGSVVEGAAEPASDIDIELKCLDAPYDPRAILPALEALRKMQKGEIVDLIGFAEIPYQFEFHLKPPNT